MEGKAMKAKPIFMVSALLSLTFVNHAVAAPTLISACRTITQPGLYILTTNLTAAGDCLVVRAEFVTIDLAGFTIAGNGTGGGITDRSNTSARGLTVRDGTIRNFSVGISLAVSPDLLIERVRLIGNTSNGLLANEHSILKDSIASDNGREGFNVGGDSLVTGNTSRRNTNAGFVVGASSTISGNDSNENQGDGYFFFCCSTIVHNTATINNGFGFNVLCPSNLIGNTAVFNTAGSLNLFSGVGCNTLNNHNLF
jgi:hypothetical protein